MMKNDFRMSYFQPPIAPVKDKTGRTVTPATLTPYGEVSAEQVFELITRDKQLRQLTEQVRTANDLRMAKASLLPYVTPCGVFSRRNSRHLMSPSHLVVIDIDHLDSQEEAQAMKRRLFEDPFLTPVLTFVSPSGRGIKAFVPTRLLHETDEAHNITENMKRAMQYVSMAYDTPVDASGKDLARACFLSHDPEAMFRK